MMANWIKKAIKRPGALTAKAKAAGESVAEFSNQALKKGSKASARTKKQASLAKTLGGFSARKKAAKEMY